jgi:tetratricopeptide (TPR) repeat protein|uniref:tetratricopeptide repeat protein n=1 Tax=Cephaloticoccus sp. TaxID=1985742 RepID=UPI0040490DD3
MSAWREELAAITGARHGGQVEHVLGQLKDLDARYPNVAEINYQLAWTCDVLGREAEALPFYEKAVALGLPENELAGALIGLGSTLRNLGQFERSAEVLRSGQAQFPDNREFDVFLALTLHDLGQPTEALKLTLEVLCDTTDDPGLTAYQRALRHYSRKLGS